MVVTVVTGNRGKAEFFCDCLAAAGMASLTLIRTLEEPQAPTIEAVARSKALQATAHGVPPLLVEDSGLVIESLGGFPGPVTRYTLETAGRTGLVRMAASSACTILSVTVLTDGHRRQHLFVDRLDGRLVASVDELASGAENDLWSLFIPDGERQPFGAIRSDRQRRYLHGRRARVSAWLKERLKNDPTRTPISTRGSASMR